MRKVLTLLVVGVCVYVVLKEWLRTPSGQDVIRPRDVPPDSEEIEPTEPSV